MRSARVKYMVTTLAAIVIYVLSYGILKQIDFVDTAVRISFTLKNPTDNHFELFYHVPDYTRTVAKQVKGQEDYQTLSFTLPLDTFGYIRIDPGSFSSEILVKEMRFSGPLSDIVYPADSMLSFFEPTNQLHTYELIPGSVLRIVTLGNDPFLVSRKDFGSIFEKFETQKRKLYILPFILAALLTLIGIAYMLFFVSTERWNTFRFAPEYLWITVFVGILFAPSLANLVKEAPPEKDEEEKRALAAYPEFTLHNMASWTHAYTRYYNDHVGFRKELIALQNYTRYAVFHTSADPEKVILGKNGWMFGASDFMKEDYQNLHPFTPQDLQKIENNLRERFLYFRERGIHYYIFIAPAKGSVYGEFMPFYITKESAVSKLDQVLNYLEDDTLIRIIDCRGELLTAKKKELVFYKKDTHWNYIGAFIGYQKFMEAVARDFPAVKPFTMDDFNRVAYVDHSQNLPEMLSLGKYLPERTDYLWLKNDFKAKEMPPI